MERALKTELSGSRLKNTDLHSTTLILLLDDACLMSVDIA